MKKLTILSIAFLLLPAFSAGAASVLHRKHPAPSTHKERASEPQAPATPPVTRLPVPPDAFRA